jgi:hypothetical protein
MAEQMMTRQRPERASEYRSTSSLPDTPVAGRRAKTLEQDENCLPLEMEIETNFESSSPTLTQRRMNQFNISDDSATA